MLSSGARAKMAPGSIVKAAIFLIGWSMLLIALLESRMVTRVEQLQKEHHRDMEELRASAKGLHHDVPDHMSVRPAAADKVAIMREAADAAEQERRAAARVEMLGSVPAPPPAQAMPEEAPQPSATAAAQEAPEPAPAHQPASPLPIGPEPPPVKAEEEEGMVMRLRSKSARPRKLAGFYTVGTTGAGVICMSFTGANSEVDMNSDNCRGAANQICPGCFIALEDANNKILEVVRCSSAKYKVGAAISGHIVEIMVLNADVDNTLEVRSCTDNICAVPLSTYTMNFGDSVVGFCYTGGSNKIYFPTMVFQNALTYNFAGKTITDLGTVQTVIIQGGSISGADITVGSGKTFDVSGGTLTLADGQIPATKITGGMFTTSQTYNFAGSTIVNGGQILTADLKGGSVSGCDVTVGGGLTLDVSAGTLTLANAQVAATKVTGGVFTASQTYSFAGSTISNLGTVTTADINGGTLDGATIYDCDVTVSSGRTLDVSAGTLTLGSGQIAAGAIGTGTFGVGTYSFAGSTLSNAGTITTADINGGTIDGVAIGATTASTGTFTNLRATGTWYVTMGLRSAFQGSVDYQSGIVWSATSNLGANGFDSVSMTSTYAGQYDPIVATAGPCTDGTVQLVNMLPQTGAWTSMVQNIGASACNGPYMIFFIMLKTT
uniref:Uncharacterized protein n=1 Tax=Alexandrium catenella TaxID=2925 RepID=A0A7S1RU30_ALECA|mmetsp:Transcript_7251/g.19609  ORF Transcript_7251/g.19609 Transcript_7251/m.19609 type:complete len:663 (+) Transcript_7251:116-2104(+)